MSIEISRETEARLSGEARKQGISVDVLLERLMNEHGTIASGIRFSPELPVWHLGSVGAFHRRDIYDDAG